ncbi:cilia- and flagella-associated protein 69 [Pholidichthys leucotaenia]
MDSGKPVHRRKPDTPVTGLRTALKSQNIREVSVKGLELSKVIRLLEDPLTAGLKERNLFVLKKLLKRNQIGFLLKELTAIAKILNICADKVKDYPEYVSFLCEALTICRLPFLKEKTSDELNYAPDVMEFLSHIGCLMRVPHDDVRQHIVECVTSFYSGVAPKQLIDGVQPTSPGYRLQLLERSELAQTLLLSTAILENQPAIKLQLLQALQLLSSSSDMNCASMLHARGAETICLHMNEPDPSGQVLFRSSEILWNLLERGSKEEVMAQLSTMECVLSLKEAFFHQLLTDSQHSVVQLRNDLLVITTFIAQNLNAPLIESLFARQLVVLSTFPELKSCSPLVHNVKFTYSNEDLKMKKLLLNLLVIMSRDMAALQLYKEERVMMGLLEIMKPLTTASPKCRSRSHDWSDVQWEELQLQALATLATIAPLMLDEYMSYQGNTYLLLLLDWCVGPDSYFAQGHSFHATGGRGSKKAHLRHSIRVLRSVMSEGEESVNRDFCDQGAINQLLRLLMQMESSPDEDDIVTLEIKSDIQLILSMLCETDMHRKELFGSKGVEMVVHFLRKGSDNFYSGLGHNKLILSTVDCVWSCIVGCSTTEDYFLAKDGAFLLLDLLGTSPRCVHGVVLATLLELCDNLNALSHILSWKDSSGQTAPRLLLRLWREEEEELGVNRNPDGEITDPQGPILNHFQLDDFQVSFPANVPTAAVLEISENVRSKIYSIFCKLGFHELPGLPAKDYVTLSIVRRYLDFKVGEVWDEISRELSLEGVRPISPDEEALKVICKISEDTARSVMVEQRSILKQQQLEDAKEEELMYKQIKSPLKQGEVAAKSWNDYVSRTSNYKILKEVKAQREKISEPSKPNQEDGVIRPAEQFIGSIIAVESTDHPGPAGVKVTLAKISMKTTGQDKGEPTTQNSEHFSAVSVRD